MIINDIPYCECCGYPIGEFWGRKHYKIFCMKADNSQIVGAGDICDKCFDETFSSNVRYVLAKRLLKEMKMKGDTE